MIINVICILHFGLSLKNEAEAEEMKIDRKRDANGLLIIDEGVQQNEIKNRYTANLRGSRNAKITEFGAFR